MIGFDIDVSGLAQKASDALTGSSLVKMAQNIPNQAASTLGDIASGYGFTAAGKALGSGRLDDLVSAVGDDAMGLLEREAGRRINGLVNQGVGMFMQTLQGRGGSDPSPAGEVLLVLGWFPFMVGTAAHQSIKRSSEYRWAKQERLVRAPARQFVGEGDTTFELAGYLLPHYTGGADSLNLLRKMAGMGEPMNLIDHFGVMYGRYAVEGIEETGTELDVKGQPRHVSFSLSLSIYGEDEPGDLISAAVQAVSAAAGRPLPAGGTGASIDNGWVI
ncbi:MAG: phage tail protein [Pigmentiphaga sp.]